MPLTQTVEANHFKQLYHQEQAFAHNLANAINEIRAYLAEQQAAPDHQMSACEIKISNILFHHKLL